MQRGTSFRGTSLLYATLAPSVLHSFRPVISDNFASIIQCLSFLRATCYSFPMIYLQMFKAPQRVHIIRSARSAKNHREIKVLREQADVVENPD